MKPYTLYKLIIDKSSYDIIKNLCEDNKIENVPARDMMFFEVLGVEGYQMPKVLNSEITYLADELFLEVVDAVSGDGKILLLGATSPALEDKYYECLDEIDEDLETISDEPNVSVVISYDYDGEDDLTYLENRMREYLGNVIKFSEMKTQYTTEDELVEFILDGREPEED